jgi:hypothetical protein
MALDELGPQGTHGGAAARIVRPYTLTAGRTRPKVDLPLEATLAVEPPATRRAWPDDMQGRIIGMCDTRSVAEVSAELHQPIGVIRVILGDLVEQGYVRVLTTITESSSTDERFDLIERTLRGLRAL